MDTPLNYIKLAVLMIPKTLAQRPLFVFLIVDSAHLMTFSKEDRHLPVLL